MAMRLVGAMVLVPVPVSREPEGLRNGIECWGAGGNVGYVTYYVVDIRSMDNIKFV